MSFGIGIGVRVSVRGETGTVRYFGTTAFAEGIWVGVELDRPLGKHRGDVGGTVYFECSAPDGLHGVFVREKLAVPLQHDPLTLEKIVAKLLLKLQAAHSDIQSLQEKLLLLESAEHRVEELATENEYLKETLALVQVSLDQLRLEHASLAADHKLGLEELALYAEMESEARSLLEANIVTPESVLLILERNKALKVALDRARVAHEKEMEIVQVAIDKQSLVTAKLDEAIHSRDSLQKQLDDAKALINLLQSQLDAALDLERVISHLSTENAELIEEINELRGTVTDLTELRDLDKSLEASQYQVEQNLRQDLTELRGIIDSNKRLITELQHKNQSWAQQASSLQIDRSLDVGVPLTDPTQELELLRLQVKTLANSNSRNAVAAAGASALELMARDQLKTASLPSPLYTIVNTKSLVSSLAERCKILAVQPEFQDVHVLPHYVHILDALILLLNARYAYPGLIKVSQNVHDLIVNVNDRVERSFQTFVHDGTSDLEFDPLFVGAIISLFTYDDESGFEQRFIRTVILSCFQYSCHQAATLISQLRGLIPDPEVHQQSQLDGFADRLNSLRSSVSIQLERIITLDPSIILIDSSKLDWQKGLHYEWQDIARACESVEEGAQPPQFIFENDLDCISRWQAYCDSEYQTATESFQCLEEAIRCLPAESMTVQPAAPCERKLLEKDKLVHDLQLSIEYLEATLDSRHCHLTEEVARLKDELKQALHDHALVQQQLAAVRREADALRKQIDKAQPFKLTAGGFRVDEYNLSDTRSQIERMKMLSEIDGLRNLAKNALESQGRFIKPMAPLHRFRPIATESGIRLAQCAASLQRIVSAIEPVKPDGANYTWKPKDQNPRFIHLRSQHELAKYRAARDGIFDQ